MARGGKRKGAGRKPGSANKRTREIADKALQKGITPLEVMLDNMSFAHSKAQELLEKLIPQENVEYDEIKELIRMRGMAQECAKDAAPYIHPRLQAIEHTGSDGGPISQVAVQLTAEEYRKMNEALESEY